MKRLVLLLAFAVLVSGCAAGEPVSSGASQALRYLHDDQHGVSCWTIGAYTLDCLPDSQVQR